MPGAATATSAVTSTSPASSKCQRVSSSQWPPVTPRSRISSAPKRSAWRAAIRARWAPSIPSGKPKKFSIIEVWEACPPGMSRSKTIVERPSEAA